MIDSHLHLWQLDRGWYGWNTPALGAVHADSMITDVLPAMAAVGVTAAVVVQAADTPAETDWLLELANHEPMIAGVVGYLPLDDPRRLDRLLPTYVDRGLVGVRQLWHDHDRPDELITPDVLSCLNILGEAGLVVDVPDAFPRLASALVDAVDRTPGTTFVLDHLGKPPFGDALGWRTWENFVTDLGHRPNVIMKLSGLFGGSGSAHSASDAELASVVALVRRTAGAERTMIGSDWPMARGRTTYAATIERLGELIIDWSDEEVAAALGGTATAVYRRSGSG